MTTQIPENTIGITADEMKAALERHFATITGNLVLQNLSLEKRIAILETSIAQLQAEIVSMNPLRATVSREGAETAGEGRAIIQEATIRE